MSNEVEMNNAEETKYRPKELDKTTVEYNKGKRIIACFCGEKVSYSIVPHLKKCHAEKWRDWKATFVGLKNKGYSWKDIMRLFRAGDGKLLFSWTVIETSIKEEIESGREKYVPVMQRDVKRWGPSDFETEKTTVWDFPKRGDWAVHSGDYRGNWPPQIPRNLLIKYTREGDLVVDAFAGGGTTLIEAWLMNRRSVGIDISKLAIQTMKAKLDQMEELAKNDERINLKSEFRPLVVEGNSLKLKEIIDDNKDIDVNKLKLVCAHPPYLDSIKYSINNKGDLALAREPDIFYSKIRGFCREVKKILTIDGVCAILIGDTRKRGKIVPIGLNVLNIFLAEGFALDNIVIKTQNRDSSTEFWIGHRAKLLLMAHEYLFILRKT